MALNLARHQVTSRLTAVSTAPSAASKRQFANVALGTSRRQCTNPSIARIQARRGYSSGPPPSSSSSGLLIGLGLVAAVGGGSYAYYSSNKTADQTFQDFYLSSLSKSASNTKANSSKKFVATEADYQAVYNAIAKRLEDEDDYDDGSYGPVLVRLAWHASGTYDALTKTGGSNGATMRFDPESDHGANAGLRAARNFLEPIKASFPWITYSDLWTLAGVAAIQEMHGPTIPWRPGREDRTIAFCTPDGRLPDASKKQDHLRAIFGRMGFDDREIVALSGAHALGRCHTDRSGFEGPWSFSPTIMSNDYFRLLVDEKWVVRKWKGPKQFEDVKTRSLMMLPTDMCLLDDPVFEKHVQRYAKDQKVFFDEFAAVVAKLFELGVPFDQVVKEADGVSLAKAPITLKPTV